MAENNTAKWYIYTKEADGIHMHRAAHTDHFRWAMRGQGKTPGRFVAGTLVPMTPAEVKRLAEYHGVPNRLVDAPALPPYVRG